MPLIPALGRQRQVGLCEFEASLVYIVSSRTVKAVTQRKPVLKKKLTAVVLGTAIHPASRVTAEIGHLKDAC